MENSKLEIIRKVSFRKHIKNRENCGQLISPHLLPLPFHPTSHLNLSQLNTEINSKSPIYNLLFPSLEILVSNSSLVRAILPLSPILLNSRQTLHGSVSATIIDLFGSLVIASASDKPLEAKRGVSVDIHVSYTSTTKEDEVLIIDGKPDKIGRTLGFVSVEIRAVKKDEVDLEKLKSGRCVGRLVAKGSHTKALV